MLSTLTIVVVLSRTGFIKNEINWNVQRTVSVAGAVLKKIGRIY